MDVAVFGRVAGHDDEVGTEEFAFHDAHTGFDAKSFGFDGGCKDAAARGVVGGDGYGFAAE